jgi:hypothetical protein
MGSSNDDFFIESILELRLWTCATMIFLSGSILELRLWTCAMMIFLSGSILELRLWTCAMMSCFLNDATLELRQ